MALGLGSAVSPGWLSEAMSMNDVTRILSAIEQGDPKAPEQLLPLVYDELRKLAAQRLAHESPGQTLQATALVHEAYLRLVGSETPSWNSRGHFFAAAAEAMRRILIENARRKRAEKHGGDLKRVELDGVDVPEAAPSDDILALDEALSKLAAEDPTKAELVKLRYFGGLSVEDAGRVLGISRATADRYWAYARVWLYSELNEDRCRAPRHSDSEKTARPMRRRERRFRTVLQRTHRACPDVTGPDHEPPDPQYRRGLLRRHGAGVARGPGCLSRRGLRLGPGPAPAGRAAPRRPAQGGKFPGRRPPPGRP